MHEALILEIKTYEFSISKGSLLVDTNVQQVAEYDAMQQDVEAMMCAPPVQHQLPCHGTQRQQQVPRAVPAHEGVAIATPERGGTALLAHECEHHATTEANRRLDRKVGVAQAAHHNHTSL